MPGMMGAEEDSSSSNPPTFEQGRSVAINSSDHGSGSESSKDKAKSLEKSLVQKMKIDDDGDGDAKQDGMTKSSPEATNKAMSRIPSEPEKDEAREEYEKMAIGAIFYHSIDKTFGYQSQLTEEAAIAGMKQAKNECLTEAQMTAVCEMMPALSETYKVPDKSQLVDGQVATQMAEEAKQRIGVHRELIAPKKVYKTLHDYWPTRLDTWKELGYTGKYEGYATPQLIGVISYYRSEISEDLSKYSVRERMVYDAWTALIDTNVQNIRKNLQTAKTVTEAMSFESEI